MGHKYSDTCLCASCEDKWRETLLRVLDKPNKKPKGKK